VLIGDEGRGLDILDLQIKIDFAPEPGFQEPKEIEIPFPVDNLLFYLIEQSIPIERQVELKNRVVAKRQNAPHVFRKYKTAKPKRLYIRCKSCRHILETQYSLLPRQKMSGTFDLFTCPDCGVEQPLSAEDFGFLEDIKGRT
jgi:RNase P subunit RPR2